MSFELVIQVQVGLIDWAVS